MSGKRQTLWTNDELDSDSTFMEFVVFLKREDTNRLFRSRVISDVIEVYTPALGGLGPASQPRALREVLLGRL